MRRQDPRQVAMIQAARRLTMRLARVFAVGIVAAFLIYAFPAAQGQDADKKVAGGGITVKGWQGKADPGNRQNLTINDAKLAPEGKGYRLTTGPAALYWSPANTGKGDFTVKATFTEAKQTYNHPHPFGVFIGGSALDTDTHNALYCAAYRNGNFIVRGFSGGKRFDVVPKPTPNAAVKTAAGPEAEVVQEVGWNVKGDKLECVINGTAVWSGAKADVTGAGKLESTDGITGIRVSHNSDAIVTGFAVGK
jgi:hypothetical protein